MTNKLIKLANISASVANRRKSGITKQIFVDPLVGENSANNS